MLNPIHCRQPQKEREINAVLFCVQRIGAYHILCNQRRINHQLSSFSQWLQYIFMGIHRMQLLCHMQLSLIFLRSLNWLSVIVIDSLIISFPYNSYKKPIKCTQLFWICDKAKLHLTVSWNAIPLEKNLLFIFSCFLSIQAQCVHTITSYQPKLGHCLVIFMSTYMYFCSSLGVDGINKYHTKVF